MYTQNTKTIPSPRQICPVKAYSGSRGLGGGRGGTMGLLVGQQRNGTYCMAGHSCGRGAKGFGQSCEHACMLEEGESREEIQERERGSTVPFMRSRILSIGSLHR